jgi:hypothetical protein
LDVEELEGNGNVKVTACTVDGAKAGDAFRMNNHEGIISIVQYQ